MGPPQAKDLLIECLPRAPTAFWCPTGAGGSDTWAIQRAAAAVEKVGEFDILFAGRQAIDGDTAQVGPQVAEKLGLPQVTYVREFEIDGKDITVKRALEDGYEVIKLQTPCVLTTIKELNTPRYMSVGGIYDAVKADIPTWGAKELRSTSRRADASRPTCTARLRRRRKPRA